MSISLRSFPELNPARRRSSSRLMTLEEDLLPFTFFIAIPAAVAGAAFGFAAFSTIKKLMARETQALAGFAASLRPRAPARVLALPHRGAHVICPYCKDEIVAEGVRVECFACSTWHHPMCFEENVGCAVFGCGKRRARGLARRPSAESPSEH